MTQFARVCGAAVVAALLWSALVIGLLQLPSSVALVMLFVGLVLFLAGVKLHWRWPAATGGLLLFAGVFAAALLGALG